MTDAGRHNEFGQPIGPDLGKWTPPSPLTPITLTGRLVTLEPLNVSHTADLMTVFEPVEASLWTYLPFGPFNDVNELDALIANLTGRPDWVPLAVMRDGRAVGFFSYLRVDPSAGTFEIGSIVFGPGLSQTTEATEALYLLLEHGFAMGYRRGEWKCDALNGPSRSAAERLGFVYEGTFVKATHYKSRSRDTAWFAITDDQWVALSEGFTQWLEPANFDSQGLQRQRLHGSSLRGGESQCENECDDQEGC